MRVSRSQLIAAGSNWLAFAATLAVAFFLTPLLLAGLGAARYGTWCYAESLLAFFTLLDMGLAACLVRGVARHRAANEPDALNRLASTTLLLFSGAGLAALLAGLPLMLAIAPALGRQTGDEADTRAFLLLMLANLAATLPLSVFPSVLDGLERYSAKSAVRIGFLALRTAAIVVVVRAEAALLPLAVVFTVSNLLEHAAMAVLARRFLPGLRLRPGLADRASFHAIRRFSIDAFLAMIAGRITVQGGVVVLGLLLPMGQIAAFATAARLVEYAKTLLRTITATLTPGVSAMEAGGDWAGIRMLFLSATRFVLYLVLPVQIGLWFFGRPFLERWVQPIAAEAAGPLFILSIALAASVVQSVASRMLYGLGVLRVFARLALAEAALTLVLLAVLAWPFGLSGAAFATAVPHVLFCIAVIAHGLRVLQIEWRTYAAAWRRPLAAGAGLAAIWAALPVPAAEWGAIGGTILAGLLPYVILAACLEAVPSSFPRWAARLGRRKQPLSSRR